MFINIAVLGTSNIKYINRICTGECNNTLRETTAKINTNIGEFILVFTSFICKTTEATIEIREETENVEDSLPNFILAKIQNNIVVLKMINSQEIPHYVGENRISIRCNYGLLFPVMQIIRKLNNNLNIYMIENVPREIPGEVLREVPETYVLPNNIEFSATYMSCGKFENSATTTDLDMIRIIQEVRMKQLVTGVYEP